MIKKIYEKVTESIRILENHKEDYVHNPGKDFSRLRKISFEDCVLSVCCMSGGTLFSELLEYYQARRDIPSVSAFLQQRSKIKSFLFEDFFKLTLNMGQKKQTYHGYRLFAADGMEVHIPTNIEDSETYFPGANGQKPYNLIHLNSLYDILENTYQDIVVQGGHKKAEHDALNLMVDRSDEENALIIADRGFESYNVMAHIQEKDWKFLIRVKDLGGNGIVSRLELPDEEEFDVDIDLRMTRKISNETKALFLDRNHYRYAPPNSKLDYLPPHSSYKETAVFYHLPFRAVRIAIAENTYEMILTNLDREIFPATEVKSLYAMRWGIETSFRTLKYNVGLIYFHSSKKDLVMQELFARIALYNISAIISSVVVTKCTTKHSYKVNSANAILICKKLFLNRIPPDIVLELLSRTVVPIRNERKFKRKTVSRIAVNFIYRVS